MVITINQGIVDTSDLVSSTSPGADNRSLFATAVKGLPVDGLKVLAGTGRVHFDLSRQEIDDARVRPAYSREVATAPPEANDSSMR